ncbi:MAG TPA: hypothetical protein VFA94_13005 [Acidimicrobiales bacterium]|nr:hypothetical protein [Acidimicrobiales bacterium]
MIGIVVFAAGIWLDAYAADRELKWIGLAGALLWFSPFTMTLGLLGRSETPVTPRTHNRGITVSLSITAALAIPGLLLMPTASYVGGILLLTGSEFPLAMMFANLRSPVRAQHADTRR